MSDETNSTKLPALPGEVWRGDLPWCSILFAVTVRDGRSEVWNVGSEEPTACRDDGYRADALAASVAHLAAAIRSRGGQ